MSVFGFYVPLPPTVLVPPPPPLHGTKGGGGATRERWPLLTVETEVNGDSRVQMKGVLPWLVCGARHSGTRDFYPALAALVTSVQNIFPHSRLFQFMCPHRTSGQAVVQGRLSLNVCLWGRVRGRREPIRTTREKAWHSVYSVVVTFEKYHSEFPYI